MQERLSLLASFFGRFCCIVSAGCCSATSLAVPSFAESGYLQKLESSAGGQYEALITPHSIRWKSKAFKYTIVSKAPDWTVNIFRDETREICHCNIDEFKRRLKGSVGSGVTLDFTTKPVAGPLVYKRYSKNGQTFTYAGKGSKGRDIFISDGKPADVEKVVVRTINLGMPQQVNDIMSTIVCMPLLPGTIFDTMEFTKANTGFWVVHTNSLSEDKAIKDAEFAVPSGYKDIGKFDGPFLYKGVSGMMDELFDGMSNSDFKKKGTRQSSEQKK